jgi:hypothetical protein
MSVSRANTSQAGPGIAGTASSGMQTIVGFCVCAPNATSAHPRIVRLFATAAGASEIVPARPPHETAADLHGRPAKSAPRQNELAKITARRP